MESDFENRIVAPEYAQEDSDVELSLRPRRLAEYIGQDKVKENLKIYIEAAKKRGETLDHVLLYGPPGLGKTTLANIIAHEMGVNIRTTSGPAIEKPGDLAALLTNLEKGDVLFIDEIHRLSRQVEEILSPAMEDYALDIIMGKGPAARSIRIELNKFKLIGATTRSGQLSAPLRDRFGMLMHMEMYSVEELADIVKRSATILGVACDDDGGRSFHFFPVMLFSFERIRIDDADVPVERAVDLRFPGADLFEARLDHPDDGQHLVEGQIRRVDGAGRHIDDFRIRIVEFGFDEGGQPVLLG